MLTSTRTARAMALVVVACQMSCVSSMIVPFRRQTSSSSSSDPFNFNVVDPNGDGNIIYAANITIDGQSFEVQLDTGSSDLWINTQGTTFTGANNTNIQATIGYLDTTVASGDVYIASAQFGSYSIPEQAFINAPGSNATSDNDRGLLGLSYYGISQVYDKLNGTSYNGKPVMYNLFDANPDTSTYITFLLARSNLGISDGGIFTIGEIDSNWSQIANQTKVPILEKSGQWLSFMDSVTVNGKNYSGHGLISALPDSVTGATADEKEKLLTLFDTGTSTGIMPEYYFDVIYKSIPGIKTISKEQSIYEVPCDTKMNVTMNFNGTEVPINPLDLTMLAMNEKNETVCVNAFIPQSTQQSEQQVNDFILGDAFLRNVYILFNYGNWTSTNSAAPYVQLLPTTIQSQAWEQFDSLNQARMQQWEQLGGQYNIPSGSS